MAFNRLKSKITKENLWLYVLKMLTDRPMYAYEISKELKERFTFSTATVTVYVVLYKMRREGLVQMRVEQPVKNRPARKYYEITELGFQTLFKGKEFIKKVINLLE